MFSLSLIGTWLLHHIRSQLSRPSEGLVSNYNLTIFLLASELRPLSHVIKLIQAHALHLQRVVSPHATEPDLSTLNPQSLSALSSRLDDLEAHIASPLQSPQINGSANHSGSSTQDVTASIRKALTPNIEALNRAVRRYEKRATVLSMQTEARLSDLKSRLSDAITLAAAAERNVNKFNRKSHTGVLLDWVSAAMALPLQAVYGALKLPMRLASGALGFIDDVVGSEVRAEMRTATGRGAGGEGGGVERDRRRERGSRARRGA